MAINYSPIQFKGKDFEEVFMETLFQNETISKNKVRLLTDIKNEVILTEMGVTVAIQAYSCGVPSASGSINMNDVILKPCKLMTYDTFCPDLLRLSRFAQQMRAGAWEIMPEQWLKIVMETYSSKTSRIMELEYWNGASAATKAAVAAIAVGGNLTAEEKAYVAAAPATVCDGILTYLIYNNAAIGSAKNVVGVTISASNIWDEYKKIYTAIPNVLLSSSNIKELKIYAPESHLQLIQLYNTDQLHRDKFFTDASGYYFLGVKIEFVPLPENTVIAGRWSDLIWGTDLSSDYSYVKVDVVQNNSDERFIKQVFSRGSAVTVQAEKVVYVG